MAGVTACGLGDRARSEVKRMARPPRVEIDVEVDLDAEPSGEQWRQIKTELHTVGIDGRTLRATVPVLEEREIRMWGAALEKVGQIEATVNPPLKIVGRARINRAELVRSKKNKKKG